jgi:hypothetical protein
VSRIGIVFEHFLDDRAADQRLQLRLQRIGFVLGVDFVAPDIEREGLGVFRLLDRIPDGSLGPFVERVVLDSLGFGLADVIGESIELAFQGCVMPVQYLGERGDGWSFGIAPRRTRRRTRRRGE